MRILHLIPTLELGGAERQLSLLAPAQVSGGHEVHVGVRRTGPFFDQLRGSGVVVHVLGDHTAPKLFLKTTKLATTLQPNIIQSWLLPMDYLGFFASRFVRARWVITERTSAPQYASWPLRSRIRIIIGRFADAIVANSTLGAKYWQDKGINASVIDNAIPPIPPPARGTLRENTRLLMVGRMTEEKSHATALEAISRLRRDFQGLELTIVGDGPLRSSLQQLIREYELSEHVKLLGKVENWWQLLHESALLMNLSTHEGQPNVVLEATAAGCPVLLSDIPAHRAILNELEATFVMPGSSEHIADAIASIIATPDAAREKAVEAQSKMFARSATKMAQQYNDVYGTII